MKFSIFFILFSAISIHGLGIDVKYGELTIIGFEECEFENNGNKYIYKSYDDNFKMDNKLLFGLINYNCDNHTGVLVSKFECKSCGLFCNYNQLVPRCRNIVVPYILGGITGAIIGTVMYICSKYAFGHIKRNVRLWYNYKVTRRNDQKHIKKVIDLSKIARLTPNVGFNDIKKDMNENKMKKILQKRDEFKSTQNSNSQIIPRIYPELPGIVIMIILGLLIGLASSCENNLFILSNGKICESNKCKNFDMVSFPIQTGQSICFRDVNDDVLSISIISTHNRIKYYHMYDTSEFEVKMQTDSLCGTECDSESCKMNAKHEKFIDKIDRIQGYTCETKSSCNRYCFSDTSCTFIHWWLEPRG